MAASPRSVFERPTTDGSPLKARPLRSPGQSVDEARSMRPGQVGPARFIDDKVLPCALMSMFFWALRLSN
jgi:hypothetical protein